MPASLVLRACMTGLVLLNLVFVQLTEATSLAWLVPLYGLTLAAPLLTRFRAHVVYRLLWNAGVLGVFALLVRHATGEDLRYVLEDGLVLAVLCQVHLVNNLRSEQRPDLLFLNAFLIAIITGWLSRDLAFFVAFLLFVPLFIVGLQLWCVALRSTEPDPAATRSIVVDGLFRATWLLGATVLVFVFWPRDFDRRGLIVTEFDFTSSSGASEVRFNDELKLERGGAARASDRVVLSVELETGAPKDVPSLWRGAVLALTDGDEWWPASSQDVSFTDLPDEGWLERGDGLERATRRPHDGAVVRVQHVDPEANYLFAPLEAVRLTYQSGIQPHRVLLLRGAIVRYGVPNLVRPDLGYRVALTRATRGKGGRVEDHGEALAPYTVLPRTKKTRSAVAQAERLIEGWSEEGEQHELVQRFCDHVSSSYAYLPPGAEGAAETLDEFLAGRAGAHCEYFASALATMLRHAGVPCRLVTGYRSRSWDDRGRVLTFRRRDAHAWVEVFDPQAGWYPVDPTPAVSLDVQASLWRHLEDRLGELWARLSGFDEEGRGAVVAWLADAPAACARAFRGRPWTAAGWTAGLAVVAVGLVVRRRRRFPASLRRLQRAQRRAGLALAPGETPRELVGRARDADVRAARLVDLERAVHEHERERYAARTELAGRGPNAALEVEGAGRRAVSASGPRARE